MMRKILNIALIALMPVLTFAQENKIVVDGAILSDRPIEGKIYFNYPVEGVITRDSVIIKNNTYHFEKTTSDGAERLVITWGRRKMIPDSVQRKFLIVWAEAGKKTILRHSVDFKKATISGSAVQTDIDNYQKELSLGTRPKDIIAEEYIRKHPSSWLSYILLEDEVRHKIISPASGITLYQVLSPELRTYRMVGRLGERVMPTGKTAIGSNAIEFVLNDVNNKPISLSSFRGKFVLIDFWASWCGPCREENPYVSKAWYQYKDKGFDVISVSLDFPGQKKAWLEAIKQDKLVWTQVSDLKGLKSEVALAYNLASIPANFLIDPSGKIIARNLRGMELENKLKEVIK